MKLTFLGVSSAFAVGDKKFHSNMIIESINLKRMLIDCGGDVRHSLYALGYTASDVDCVYISHLHGDHVGGLEWLGLSKFFAGETITNLYISPDQSDRLWNNVLAGGMSTLEDTPSSLNTYFKVESVENLQFSWEGCPFKLIKVIHSYNNGCLLPSYGLFINGKKLNIFITTDTRFSPELLEPIYQQADLIFHDCEISLRNSGQHATYSQLKSLNPDIKRKMWLYDYNCDKLPDAIADGFLGFVTRGQSFSF